jgi:uncharacterized protein
MLWKWCFRLLVICVGLWLILDLVSRLGAEIFWFENVGYLQVFLLRIFTRGGLWILIAGVTAAYLLGNLSLAQKLKYPPYLKIAEVRQEEAGINTELENFLSPHYPKRVEKPRPKNRTQPLRLIWLLPLAAILSVLVGLILVHYSEIAINYWHTPIIRDIPPIPALFRPERIWQLLTVQIFSQGWYMAVVVGGAIAILIYPQFLLQAIAVGFSILFAWIISHNWARILQYFAPTSFNSTEPLFNLDISFYIFSLPFWEILELWLMGLFLYAFVAVCLTYLLSADSLSQGIFPGFSPEQQRHLYGLGGLFMLIVAFSYWLSRYELVYSPRGVTYGASYTDVNAVLPAYTILSLFALTVGCYLLWRTYAWKAQSSKYRQLVFYGLGVYLLVVLTADFVLPNVVQYLIVQPNELQREQPYIQRTIALTRQAFDLDNIEVQTFNPTGDLTEADIQRNDLTIRNIRLWDQQPLLETNRQLQQIRLYFRFPDADIDRYTLLKEVPAQRPTAPEELTADNLEQENTTERRQVLIAGRELDYTALPEQAQTWVNRHLIYTHGYGFTMSPVNTVGPGGLPEYFVKDIAGDDENPLNTSSQAIRDSIPIGQPRIYFGEITDNYVMTGTSVGELDFQSGTDSLYKVYDGVGGINIGTGWRRLLFAMYLKDWQMLFTEDFLPETKVLFRRNIKERIQAIAPFLQFDSDPYLVAADANPDNGNGDFASNGNYLFWIIDAYTTSDRYPYSDTTKDQINYIRNSVKVVIDAYHGTVNFYIADPRDPIIATWAKIFPNTFKPLSDLPHTLLSHIRYPVDFFKIQSERLMTYHMTDPQVFYNREDQWQIPNEIYADEPRAVAPYYLITSLPTVPFEEFILLLPYTPRQRSNLIAWLAARSDGENYGKLLLYVFPKERLVFGPEQIEARINQDPIISQQISLWNRQGSRAVQGNLLIIPIEQSLLYVEPIYLEATQNRLPTLVRVIVAFENRIVMAPTLEQALQGIFQPEVTPEPAIIRPLEEPAPTE